jgi:methylthioribose-1-phosphate isomerase
MGDLNPIEWKKDKLILLDQTLLPGKEKYLKISDYREVVAAIKRLAVRGAPAIGIAAAYGAVLGAQAIETSERAGFLKEFKKVTSDLAASRPTARNLFWALERMQEAASQGKTVAAIKQALTAEAQKIHEEQIVIDDVIGRYGAGLLKGGTVLTHCNAGGLATGGAGTALGIIKEAFRQGKIESVIASETRPLLQGARLTAFELKKAGIPFALITDSMAGSLMRQGKIQAVVTGADRIALNGDTANKIGTYSLAVLAKAHGIPFYIAAPMSTVDLSIASGKEIVIEQRAAEEVTCFQGVHSAPQEIQVYNPAFDVTPHELITAIITEKGVIRSNFKKGLKS